MEEKLKGIIKKLEDERIKQKLSYEEIAKKINSTIVSTLLEDKYGFECKVDYDKDFATDEYYSLKIATYKKKIVGNLEIHITDSFKFVEAPDTYKYQSTTVEIVQGAEFQEIKIDKMWQLLMLIDMLQGVQRHSS